MTTPYLALETRSFPVALAQVCANLSLREQDRHARINRIVANMTPAAKLAFHAELQAVRAAKRGENLAIIEA